MSISLCAVSGLPLTSPVFCMKTGKVYEQAVIFNLIETNGRCPLTNELININDCVSLQPSDNNKSTYCDTCNVPAIIDSIGEEWNDLVLETFKVKHQNEELRQELSFALFQYEAACRTIEKLLTEVEEFKVDLQVLNKDT